MVSAAPNAGRVPSRPFTRGRRQQTLVRLTVLALAACRTDATVVGTQAGVQRAIAAVDGLAAVEFVAFVDPTAIPELAAAQRSAISHGMIAGWNLA